MLVETSYITLTYCLNGTLKKCKTKASGLEQDILKALRFGRKLKLLNKELTALASGQVPKVMKPTTITQQRLDHTDMITDEYHTQSLELNCTLDDAFQRPHVFRNEVYRKLVLATTSI